jgi:hypothetical protein
MERTASVAGERDGTLDGFWLSPPDLLLLSFRTGSVHRSWERVGAAYEGYCSSSCNKVRREEFMHTPHHPPSLLASTRVPVFTRGGSVGAQFPYYTRSGEMEQI